MKTTTPQEAEVLYQFRNWFFIKHDPISEKNTFWKKIKTAVYDIINNAIVEYIQEKVMEETRDTEID